MTSTLVGFSSFEERAVGGAAWWGTRRHGSGGVGRMCCETWCLGVNNVMYALSLWHGVASADVCVHGWVVLDGEMLATHMK